MVLSDSRNGSVRQSQWFCQTVAMVLSDSHTLTKFTAGCTFKNIRKSNPV